MKAVTHCLDDHLRVGCSTVFLDISEPFLDDAKQAQRYFWRYGARHAVLGEYNLNSALSGELRAERTHSHSQAKLLKCCRMQPVRQGMQIGAKLAGGVHKLAQLSIHFAWGLASCFRCCFESQRQHSQPLTEIIM